MSVNIKELIEHMKEIEKLYELTEAEARLLAEMLITVKDMGLSPKPTLKLMKVLTALMEISVDAFERQKK